MSILNKIICSSSQMDGIKYIYYKIINSLNKFSDKIIKIINIIIKD